MTSPEHAAGSLLIDGMIPDDAAFGLIPGTGDGFEAQGWRFEVADRDERRIDTVLASHLAQRGAAAARLRLNPRRSRSGCAGAGRIPPS